MASTPSNQCGQDFEHIKNQFPSLYNFSRHHGYNSDFHTCTTVNIPSKLCSIYKTIADIESICMPRSCTDDKIHQILRQLKFYRIDCKNVNNPSEYLLIVCLFFITILIITIIGTTFNHKISKKFLPYPTNPIRHFLRVTSAFSLSDNFKTLFNTKSSSSSIDCLNGIKALSMPFIVMRHAFQIVTNYQKARHGRDHERLNIHSLHITGILPTDTFFVVTGILCAKFFIHRKSLFSKFPQNFFQRYMRLTPSGIVVMAVFIAIKFHLMPTHPNYFYDPEIENCKTYWWTSVLHIQNYLNVSDMCFGSFWFATVSIQMFLVTPLIMLVLKYVNLFFGLILMVPTLIYTQIPAYNEMMRTRSFMGTICGYYYTEAVTRSYPYLIGLFYYWMSTKTSKLELPKFLTSKSGKFCSKLVKILEIFSIKLLWVATALTVMSPIILYNNNSLSHDDLNLHYLTVRIFWPFALCWIVHACHNGFGGIANKILAAKIWFPLSNISLGIYLMNDHTALYLTEWLLKSPAGFTWNDIFYIFILTYIVCVINSVILFLLVEVPFHRLAQGRF
ncbi:O-acyltransferase like protein-like [Chironomus tepperi]|uniref:O-acyltransferase like protein-like n=1 Tax=Chironomus tepperi TaxID=113505 RepID=UPI00391F8C7E